MSRKEANYSMQEREMVVSYREQASQLLTCCEDYRKDEARVKCGFELEFGLIRDDYQQPEENDRNKILKRYKFSDKELGAAQIELRTDPLDLKNGSESLFRQFLIRSDNVKKVAAKLGLKLIQHGSNPFITIGEIKRTDLPKYRIVPDFHNERRIRKDTFLGNDEQEKIDVGDAAIIGLTNSVQANIEAKDENDAIDKLNRSLFIGPIVVSAFANARFLEYKDTGLQDSRMVAWELSHDTRTLQEISEEKNIRVGLPKRYYSNLEDYLNEIMEFPFILHSPDNALPIAIGLNWRDARIKVIDSSFVVEFRPVSTQTTTEMNFAAMVFYLGRLFWSQDRKEPLLPFDKLKENRTTAMKDGLNASLWTFINSGFKRIPARKSLKLELERAEKGLKNQNCFDYYIQSALELVRHLESCPARSLAESREKYLKKGVSRKNSLRMAFEESEIF